MTAKQVHRPESDVRNFFDTLLANEMPEVWAFIYILALICVGIFLLSG